MKTEDLKRYCSLTGEPIHQGFVVRDGELYFKYEKDLINYLRFVEMESNPNYLEEIKKGRLTDEFILNDYYNSQYYYFTNWNE